MILNLRGTCGCPATMMLSECADHAPALETPRTVLAWRRWIRHAKSCGGT